MQKRTQKAADVTRAEDAIAKAAESYPDVIEAGPWGHRAFKIRGKTFLFMATYGGELSFSVKLPISGKAALALAFTEPTHYGLGKAGWVTARFKSGGAIPLSTVLAWLDESFRAIAPKSVVAALAPSTAVKAPRAARKKAKRAVDDAKKKTVKKTAKKTRAK